MMETRAKYYILDENRQPIPIYDVREWAKQFDEKTKRVADHITGKLWISTVFLGIDYNFSFEGEPLLFETMIFDQSDKENSFHDLYCDRCATYEQALEMHEKAIEEAERMNRTAGDNI